MNILSSQSSPKNILNILNNDCIKAILLKLEKVEDFLSAAEKKISRECQNMISVQEDNYSDLNYLAT